MITIQIATILFSIACAWLNKIPVRKMIDYGASLSEERQFHRANAAIKVLFSAICCYHFVDVTNMVLCFLTVSLIQWAVFDPALNLFVGKKWHYIGTTASIDKRLNRLFPHDAGEAKAFICLGLILLLNIVIHGNYLK